MAKRTLDIFAALAGIILLFPIMVALAVAVRMTSRGPALFRQKRVGKGGLDFTLLKFRSMTVRSGSEKGDFDAGNLSRITRLGRFLRQAKLDELPQLWNVLKGDMSLVGPRPEVRKWVDVYPERWAHVLSVRPGITDPASIEFRNEEELLAASPDPEKYYREVILPRKLDLYEKYVESHRFFGDIMILLRTMKAVVFK